MLRLGHNPILRSCMHSISKKLIGVVAFIIVLIASGWLWYASKVVRQQQIISVAEDQDRNVSENQSKDSSSDIVARNLDVSKWKTYKNEERGIEFKYPEEMFDIKIDGVSGAGVINGPDELRVWLTQKGYSTDDSRHTFIVSLSFLKSLTEYYAEKEGTCKFVDVAGKKGKICEHGGYNEFQDTFNRYSDFTSKSVCSGEFIVRFDEKRLESGDFESMIAVGCNNDFDMNKIYRSMYESIHFFQPKASREK